MQTTTATVLTFPVNHQLRLKCLFDEILFVRFFYYENSIIYSSLLIFYDLNECLVEVEKKIEKKWYGEEGIKQIKIKLLRDRQRGEMIINMYAVFLETMANVISNFTGSAKKNSK